MSQVNWVWLIHPEFGVHRVPNNHGVIPPFEARGWTVTDLSGDIDQDDPDFIEALEVLQTDDLAEAKPAKAKKSVKAESATESEKEDE